MHGGGGAREAEADDDDPDAAGDAHDAERAFVAEAACPAPGPEGVEAVPDVEVDGGAEQPCSAVSSVPSSSRSDIRPLQPWYGLETRWYGVPGWKARPPGRRRGRGAPDQTSWRSSSSR